MTTFSDLSQNISNTTFVKNEATPDWVWMIVIIGAYFFYRGK